MKNIILYSLVFLLSSCMITPKSPFDMLISDSASMSMEEMNKRYPYLKVKMTSFLVYDEDPGEYGPSPPIITDEMKKKSRRLKVACKERILQMLNTIRFVVITPEFTDNLRKQQFYAYRNGNTIKKRDPFDPEQLLKVVQKASFYTQIRRRRVAWGTGASASIGPFLYEITMLRKVVLLIFLTKKIGQKYIILTALV